MLSRLRPVVFSALLLVAALAQGEPRSAHRAFYFWRTTFDLSATERATLAQQRVERLYLRFFDVGLKPGTARAVPLGRVAFAHDVPAGLQVVPVVYLANAVFEAGTEPVALADQVLAEVAQVAQGPATSITFDELQVDCDWTVGTRVAFFRFCQRSSIFDEATAKKYTASLKSYPLPLDAALPIFGWAIHGRAGRIVGSQLRRSVLPEEVHPSPSATHRNQVSASRFELPRSKFFELDVRLIQPVDLAE
jgi:hypothetical protein